MLKQNPTSRLQDRSVTLTPASPDRHIQVVVPGLSALYELNEDVTLLAGVHRGFAIASPGDFEAVKLIAASQNGDGGWRYLPESRDAALNLFGSGLDGQPIPQG